MEMTGQPDGPPMMAGTFVIDYGTALYAVAGTLAALRARDRTGVGQRVDVALLDTGVSFLITAIPEYLLLGRKMTRLGNRDRYCAPANLFRSKDGQWVYIAAANDSLFPQLVKVMGREDVLQDPRFATNEARMAHVDEAEDVLAKWVGGKTAEEVVGLVRGAGLPCAKIASIADVVVNPQVRHRGMLVEVEHPTAGRVPMQGLHTHFSETPMQIRCPAPLLGQHNEEVYGRWLGARPSQVAQLKAEGVI